MRQPNHLSVVLEVTVGTRRVLLGGDLEHNAGRSTEGWQAIIDDPHRTTQRSAAYKVAHHGSMTAHHEGVWDDLLDVDPVAIVSPFTLGRVVLPTPEGKRLLLSRTKQAYITLNRLPQPKTRPGVVERQLVRHAMNRRVVEAPIGHIRLRADGDGSGLWSTALFGAAATLRASE